MSRWLFPWSGSIKKRACRYLLQHYLGHFLQERLSLDQLGLDLYNGSGVIKEINLDVWVSLWQRGKGEGGWQLGSPCCSHGVFLTNSCTPDCFATALEFNNNLQRHAPSLARFLRRSALVGNTSSANLINCISPWCINSLNKHMPPCHDGFTLHVYIQSDRTNIPAGKNIIDQYQNKQHQQDLHMLCFGAGLCCFFQQGWNQLSHFFHFVFLSDGSLFSPGGQWAFGVSRSSSGDSGWLCEQHSGDHPLASSPDWSLHLRSFWSPDNMSTQVSHQ